MRTAVRLLLQEELVEVRAMNHHVAARAVAARLEAQAAVWRVGGERIDMALQAEEARLASGQQQMVHAAMRRVAGDAPFHLHGGMLVDERPPLLDVALHAGFETGLPQL